MISAIDNERTWKGDERRVTDAIQVSCVVALWAAAFFYTFYTLVDEGHDVAYATARGAGAALKFLLPLIFLPTLRMLHGKTYRLLPNSVQNSVVGSLFHGRMSFHKFLGEAFLGSAALHTGAHIVRASVAPADQESLTGITMLACATFPIATMYVLRARRFSIGEWAHKKSYYLQFLLPHQIGWWGLVTAYALHTRDLRLFSWAMGFTGLFCIDRFWEWLESKNVKVLSVERVHERMILIEMQRPRQMVLKAGDKAYIANPPESAFLNNLHPLTLASSDAERVLRFVVSTSGEWTRKLVEGLKAGDSVRVSPPFPSPLGAEGMKTPKLLITSGAGLAMTLAHLHDDSDDGAISVVHTTRNPEEFSLLGRFSRRVVQSEYYDTGQGGRFVPEASRLVAEFVGRVFFCGGEALGDALARALAGRRNVRLFRERFSF